MGVLWLHSSVNLVEPRSIALAAALILRRLPKIKFRLAPPSPRRNRVADGRPALVYGCVIPPSGASNFALTMSG